MGSASARWVTLSLRQRRGGPAGRSVVEVEAAPGGASGPENVSFVRLGVLSFRHECSRPLAVRFAGPLVVVQREVTRLLQHGHFVAVER